MKSNTKTSLAKTTTVLLAICTAVAVLTSQNSYGQVLFSIDDATVSGGDVIQTVSVGGTDFQLTASYFSGAGAALFDLGGGDQAFFSSDTSLGAGVTGFRLSLTQDGAATNFSLNQIDFASFGFGNAFDILNDNGDLITNDFAIPGSGAAGTVSIDNLANATNVQFIDFIGNSAVSTLQTDFHNISLTAVAVPEPNCCVVCGFITLGLLGRRRRR